MLRTSSKIVGFLLGMLAITPAVGEEKATPPPSEECRQLKILGLLATTEDRFSADELKAMRAYETMACEPVEGDVLPTQWPNGNRLRDSSGWWYYPSGQAAFAMGEWKYPADRHATSNGTWRYPNHDLARDRDGTFRVPSDPLKRWTASEVLLRAAAGDETRWEALRKEYAALPAEVRPAFVLRTAWQAQR